MCTRLKDGVHVFNFIQHQCLLDPPSPRCQVKWARENYHHHIGSPYSLRLASADASGKIIVWDVAAGVAQCEIQEHAKPIQGEGRLRSAVCIRALSLSVFSPIHSISSLPTELWIVFTLVSGSESSCFLSLYFWAYFLETQLI